MGVVRRDWVRCLIREYDQLTCSDTVSGTHTAMPAGRSGPVQPRGWTFG